MNFLFVIPLLLFIVIDIETKIPSKWVDPSDIYAKRGRYSSFRNTAVKKGVEDEVPKATFSAFRNVNQNSCSAKRDNFDHMFASYKRFVKVIMKILTVNHQAGGEYLLQLNVPITQEQHAVLEDFGALSNYDGNAFREIEDVLSDIFAPESNAYTTSSDSKNWTYIMIEIFSSTQNLILFYLCGVTYIVYRLIFARFSILRALCIFFLVAFITGFGWTWYSLIEEEEIRLLAARMQHPIPPECDKKLSWFQKLFSTQQTDCLKYVEAHHRTAYLAVTPQMVLAEMFGQTFSQIIGHGISAVSTFMTMMMSLIPWPLNILAFPFLLVFLLMLITQTFAFLFGVNFRLNLFHLLNYEVGSQQTHRNYVEDIKKRKKEKLPLKSENNAAISDQKQSSEQQSCKKRKKRHHKSSKDSSASSSWENLQSIEENNSNVTVKLENTSNSDVEQKTKYCD